MQYEKENNRSPKNNTAASGMYKLIVISKNRDQTDQARQLTKWEYTQLRFVPRGKSWTGEIEELWLDDQQIISRRHPQRSVTLVGLMNELGSQGWELATYAQPFTGYHGGCYTFKRLKSE